MGGAGPGQDIERAFLELGSGRGAAITQIKDIKVGLDAGSHGLPHVEDHGIGASPCQQAAAQALAVVGQRVVEGARVGAQHRRFPGRADGAHRQVGHGGPDRAPAECGDEGEGVPVRTQDVHVVGDRRIAVVDRGRRPLEIERSRTLDVIAIAEIQTLVLGVADGEKDPAAGVGQGATDRPLDPPLRRVAPGRHARGGAQAGASKIVPQHHIDHASGGVRAKDAARGRGQGLDPIDGRERDGVQVRLKQVVGQWNARKPSAIDQDQGLRRAQAAKINL